MKEFKLTIQGDYDKEADTDTITTALRNEEGRIFPVKYISFDYDGCMKYIQFDNEGDTHTIGIDDCEVTLDI